MGSEAVLIAQHYPVAARQHPAGTAEEFSSVDARLRLAYRDRAASDLKRSQPVELSRVWADLEYNLPKQFVVGRLQVAPARLHAEVTRQKGETFLDGTDLGRALGRSSYFGNAVLRPQEKLLLTYSVDR